MQATLPFRVYPSCGMETPEPITMDDGPGIYYVPGACPNGSRLAFAYDAGGTIVDGAMFEPGADLNRVRWDLHQAIRAASRRP